MATERKLMTAEELEALPDDDVRRELIEGMLVTMSPAGGRHGKIANEIAYWLTDFNKRHGKPGEICINDTGSVLERGPDIVRAPDIGFFRREHLPGGEVPTGFFDGVVPDLVVEVVSPSDRMGEVLAKAETWLRAGAQVVWLVDPATEQVAVLRPQAELHVAKRGDTLDAEPVLSGFSVPVAELFA